MEENQNCCEEDCQLIETVRYAVRWLGQSRGADMLKNVRKVEDCNGFLTVTFSEAPSVGELRAFCYAWAEQGKAEENVEFIIEYP